MGVAVCERLYVFNERKLYLIALIEKPILLIEPERPGIRKFSSLIEFILCCLFSFNFLVQTRSFFSVITNRDFPFTAKMDHVVLTQVGFLLNPALFHPPG